MDFCVKSAPRDEECVMQPLPGTDVHHDTNAYDNTDDEEPPPAKRKIVKGTGTIGDREFPTSFVFGSIKEESRPTTPTNPDILLKPPGPFWEVDGFPSDMHLPDPEESENSTETGPGLMGGLRGRSSVSDEGFI